MDNLRNKIESIKENDLSNYSTDEARENLNKLVKSVKHLVKLDQEYIQCNNLICKYLERLKI